MALGDFGGQDGLHYLCSKYSTLITRLREEVLLRQKAEVEMRALEKKLQDQASVHNQEKSRWEAEMRATESKLHDEAGVHDQEKKQWEEERWTMQEELTLLRSHQQEAHDARRSDFVHLQRSATTSVEPTARCDQLPEACDEEAHRAMSASEQAVFGNEVLIRQGEELSRLRREHAELTAQHKEVYEELIACREHLARWRRTASEMEGKVDCAARGREEAETRARQLQEEMRQALRAASVARSREASATSLAGRGERELRSRDERLAAVRREGQRFAQRASSAERRLAKVQGYEAAAERVARESRELRSKLDTEIRACELARLDMAKAEASEARASAATGEATSELRAQEAIATTSRQRAAELESELARVRSWAEQLEGERTSSSTALEGLRAELRVARDECEDVRRGKERLALELGDSRRRIDRGQPQLVECRRKLCSAEDALARVQSEAQDERLARERCHTEAIRAGEKLRIARAQCTQLRDRVRALEEVELRYRSRGVRSVVDDFKSSGGECVCHLEPDLGHRMESTRGVVAQDSDDVRAVREFVAQEDQRLAELSPLSNDFGPCGPHGNDDPMCLIEEPRVPAAPVQAPPPLIRHGGWEHASMSNGDPELAALLAAEPRVMRLASELQPRLLPSFAPIQ